MPKQKTHRGAAKRFRQTGRGKLKRSKANHSHILTKKDPKRKRRLVRQTLVSDEDARMVRALLPYGRP
jgi:large subunit ribosomal protein L35